VRVGHAGEAGPRRKRRRRGLSLSRTRLEVGDDGWPPPVSRRRQRRRGEGASRALGACWAGLQQATCGRGGGGERGRQGATGGLHWVGLRKRNNAGGLLAEQG
jgi:hypothetical protein